MIRTTVFDAGGVLHSLESEHIKNDIIDTLGIASKQYDHAILELAPNLRLGKITEQEFWKQFIEMTQAPNPLPKKSLWAREYSKRYNVHDETIDIVNTLKTKGFKIAILSNTIAVHAKINRQMGIYKPFAEVILSCEVSLAKPDPKIYKLALRKLNAKPEQTVFVDDRAENTSAAATLGINAILFQDAKQLIAELNELGIHIT